MKGRLLSLDVLRGLDMVLLTVVGPLQNGWRLSWGIPECVTHQFSHGWSGFTLWDLIQPLFIFMCGAAIPFALGKRLEADGRPGRAYWRHVAGRFAMLYALGFVADRSIFKLDPLAISPIGNTLQLIAVGYLLAALVFPLKSRLARIAPFAVFLVVYGVVLAAFGDWTPDGNAAVQFDRWAFGFAFPPESVVFRPRGYSRLLTLPVYGFLTVAGLEATQVLRAEWTACRKVLTVAGAGAALAVAGLVLSPWVPMIKHVYSPSFTLVATGYSLMLLAACHLLTDVIGFRRGLWLFVLYGQTSLAAYMLYTFFAPAVNAVASAATVGVARIWPAAGPFAASLASAAFITWVLYLWRGSKLKELQMTKEGHHV